MKLPGRIIQVHVKAGQAVRRGHGRTGDLAALHVDAANQGGLQLARFRQAVIGQKLDVAMGDVGQGLGRGARIGAGHVGDAIVGDAFLDKDRVVVSRCVRGLGAPALVDGDIHQNTAGAHAAEHFAVDQPGGLRSGHEDGADQQIDRRKEFHQVRLAGIQGVRGVQGNVEKAHPLEIDLKDGNVRAQADGHAGGIDAGHAATQHHHLAGQDARHATE